METEMEALRMRGIRAVFIYLSEMGAESVASYH